MDPAVFKFHASFDRLWSFNLAFMGSIKTHEVGHWLSNQKKGWIMIKILWVLSLCVLTPLAAQCEPTFGRTIPYIPQPTAEEIRAQRAADLKRDLAEKQYYFIPRDPWRVMTNRFSANVGWITELETNYAKGELWCQFDGEVIHILKDGIILRGWVGGEMDFQHGESNLDFIVCNFPYQVNIGTNLRREGKFVARCCAKRYGDHLYKLDYGKPCAVPLPDDAIDPATGLPVSTLKREASSRLCHLGEAPAQADARYGAPVLIKTNAAMEMRWYTWKERDVQVLFTKGQSIAEKISGTVKSPFIETAEMMSLGKAVAGRDDWKQVGPFGAETVFESGAFKMTLGVRRGEPTSVYITGPAYVTFRDSQLPKVGP